MKIFNGLKSFFDNILSDNEAFEATNNSDSIHELNKKKTNIEKTFCESFKTEDVNSQFNTASELFETKEYQTCILAYKKLADLYSEKRCFCEMQIARVLYKQGEHEASIKYLNAARVHGADEKIVERYLWENCKALVDHELDYEKRKQIIQRYLTLFPIGSHCDEAKEYLYALSM